MINLENTCILVKTTEENEMLLKEAENQGFHWIKCNNCKPLLDQYIPDILIFYEDKDIAYGGRINHDFIFYEASELLDAKEMTVREFAERIADISDCCRRECAECVLDEMNTKCNESLCNTCNWENNIDELIEIAKSGRYKIPPYEEKVISTLEKFIENPDCLAIVNNELVYALKLAVEKLKEVK